MHKYEVLRKPLITEKGTIQQEQSKYLFEVDCRATKAQVKEAVESAFKVKVVKVNVVTMPGQVSRMSRRQAKSASWKKAVVTLVAGDKIQIFEGV